MASVNKVILVGNLGRDPEIRYTASGTPVANFTMATTDRWNDPSGERKNAPSGIASSSGQAGRDRREYLKKGRQVYVEARCRRANGPTARATSATPPRSGRSACRCSAAGATTAPPARPAEGAAHVAEPEAGTTRRHPF